jgi:hypothetical protein
MVRAEQSGGTESKAMAIRVAEKIMPRWMMVR